MRKIFVLFIIHFILSGFCTNAYSETMEEYLKQNNFLQDYEKVVKENEKDSFYDNIIKKNE